LQFNHASSTYSLNGTVGGAPFASTSTVSANTGVEVLRVGLSYLFNWGAEPLVR